jgi:hypothetical protein
MVKTKFTVKTIDAIVAAILAYRVNGNAVLRFDNEHKKVDNKTLIGEFFESTITIPEDEFTALKEEAELIKLQLEQRLTLNAITGARTSEFLQNVIDTISKDSVDSRNFGIVAWVPKLHNDILSTDDARSQLVRFGASSRFIGQPGNKVTLTFTSITVKYLKDYNSFVHQGHDEHGNLIKFFNKNLIEGTKTISARIKANSIDERIGAARVTALNYVKVI